MSRAGKTKIKRRIFTFGLVQFWGCGQGGTGGVVGISKILSQAARRGNVPPQQLFDPGGEWKEQSWNISSSSSLSLGAKGGESWSKGASRTAGECRESLQGHKHWEKIPSAEWQTPNSGSEASWSSIPPMGDAQIWVSIQPWMCTAPAPSPIPQHGTSQGVRQPEFLPEPPCLQEGMAARRRKILSGVEFLR